MYGSVSAWQAFTAAIQARTASIETVEASLQAAEKRREGAVSLARALTARVDAAKRRSYRAPDGRACRKTDAARAAPGHRQRGAGAPRRRRDDAAVHRAVHRAVLHRAVLPDAARAAAVVGAVDTEQVLDVLFADFCIGK